MYETAQQCIYFFSGVVPSTSDCVKYSNSYYGLIHEHGYYMDHTGVVYPCVSNRYRFFVFDNHDIQT